MAEAHKSEEREKEEERDIVTDRKRGRGKERVKMIRK